MTPYEVIKVLKKIGFRDARKIDSRKYSFPTYEYRLNDNQYRFEASLSGDWMITKFGLNTRTINTKMESIPDFIDKEFGIEYLREHNIEKILR